MTTIVAAASGFDYVISAATLNGLVQGDVTIANSSEFAVDTSPGPVVTFTGNGFTYSSAGAPTSGVVTGVKIQNAGASTFTTWSGFSVSAPTLWSDIETLNTTAVDNLFFSGNDTFTGSVSADNFSGFAGNDTFNLSQSGNDTASGGPGNDTFNLGAALTAADKIDGGAGTDTLNLKGNYASGVTFGSTTLVNVEKIALAAGYNYKLTTNNATVASGQTLTINGAALSASNVLTFNGAAETNGHFIIIGGNGADHLTGGALSDTFTYTSAAQSTGTNYDTITGFNFSKDIFDTPGAVGTITGINTKVTSGALSTGTFDANLTSAISSNRLSAHHAVLFTPNGGTLKGQTFLVVDLNGTAGYQAGADLVIRMVSASGTLAAGGFH